MSWVTLDQGNSSLKWCLWGADERGVAIVQRRGLSGAGGALDEWSELEACVAGAEVEAAFYCGVAGGERADVTKERWAKISAGVTLSEPRETLINACKEPALVGRDRLMAAQGAHAQLGVGVLIVDAGTALTVDALGEGPTFLGGAIAPGPRALAAALGAAGEQLHVIEPAPEVRALGRTTGEALDAGVSVGFAGAAAQLVEEIAREAGFSDATVAVTGGARAFLERPGLFGSRQVYVYSDLVHLGLLAAAGIAAELQEESCPSESAS